MKLAFVVQRYGPEARGGAEAHCAWLARRLSARHEVEVLTTCARDYAEWRNHYPPGRETIDGISVTRFPVQRPRDPSAFALYSDIVFRDHHTEDDEREWVAQNGPLCPALVAALPGMRADLFVFYSYRYYTTFHGLPPVKERAVLVPTAEEDDAVRLPIFGDLFRAPRGLLYLTPEEQALVEGVSGNAALPHAVTGGAVDIPAGFERIDVMQRFSLPERYLLYVGRVDAAKGVDTLIDYYRLFAAEDADVPPLVLAGASVLEVPPQVRHLGVVSDEEKYALIAGCELLLLPSRYESLSLSVLEAWAMGRPVLVNGECKVLEGQCLRSNGGLPYVGYAEFAPALRLLLGRSRLREALGRSGQAYVGREYAPEVVERRALELLERLPLRRELG